MIIKGGQKSANEIAFDAVRPWIDMFARRDSAGWLLNDPGVDAQRIVNDVIAGFAREGYELRPSDLT